MDFWCVRPRGEGFALFGGEHIFYLAFLLALTISLSVFYRRAGEPRRRKADTAIAVILLAAQSLRLAVIAVQGELEVGFLPLHLCGLAVFIEAWYALSGGRGGRAFGDVLYAACAPGALMAMLFPDWTDYPAFSFLSQNSFLIHALLTAYPAALAFSGRIRPDWRNIPRVFAFLLALAVPMYFFNKVFGTNFMFLNWPSPGSPLEWFAYLGRPGYLLGYLPIAAVVWSTLYLPWAVFSKEKQI